MSERYIHLKAVKGNFIALSTVKTIDYQVDNLIINFNFSTDREHYLQLKLPTRKAFDLDVGKLEKYLASEATYLELG